MKPPLPIQPTRRTPDDGRKVVAIVILAAIVAFGTIGTAIFKLLF